MLAGEGSLSVFSGPRTFFESERGAENFLRKTIREAKSYFTDKKYELYGWVFFSQKNL